MPRKPRKASLVEVAQDCFRTGWFREFKNVHASIEPRSESSEDMAWGAAIYVTRKAIEALGRSLTTMEKMQVLELCRCALAQEGDS